jgi:L-alanine-DL-glutamate epimerase-like enolase superfamily enzyme
VERLESALRRLASYNLEEREAFLDAVGHRLEGVWSALQAVDLAVHDWWAKQQNLPLYRCLGIDPLDMPATSWTIGIDHPQAVARQALEAAEFHILKLKLGSDHDREMVRALRAVDRRPLRVDANEGWDDRERALREIEWLALQGVEVVEQPLPADRFEDLVWLKRRSPLPLFADESFPGGGALEPFAEAFHGVNVKLAKCGGILPALCVMKRAKALGLKVMMGCMVESSCGIAGAAQIAPLADLVDLDSNLYLSRDPFRGHPVVEGRIRLTSLPGLGVVPAPPPNGDTYGRRTEITDP